MRIIYGRKLGSLYRAAALKRKSLSSVGCAIEHKYQVSKATVFAASTERQTKCVLANFANQNYIIY